MRGYILTEQEQVELDRYKETGIITPAIRNIKSRAAKAFPRLVMDMTKIEKILGVKHRACDTCIWDYEEKGQPIPAGGLEG